MTTTVRIRCRCALVTVTPDDLLLMVSGSDPDNSYVSVRCPECHRLIRQHVTPRQVGDLVSVGCRPLAFDLDAPVAPRRALSYDDLLDLQLALLETDEVAAVLYGEPANGGAS